MSAKHEFRKKADYLKMAPLTALAYAGYIPSLYLQQTFNTAADFAGHMALISGIFLSLRTPILREVPLALTTLFTRVVMARKITTPDQQTLEDFEDLKRKAGIKAGVKLHFYERGVTKNAFTNGKDVYVGRSLVEEMNRAELKSVIAHELSHIKAGDVSERYLTWPPYIDSLLLAIGSGMTLVDTVTSGNMAMLPAATLMAATSFAYFNLQSALSSAVSRIGEYRADRNGINLTGDFKSAATAMAKLDSSYVTRIPGHKQIFASHPRGLDRLRAMEMTTSRDGSTPVIDLIGAIDDDRENELFKFRTRFINPAGSIERTYRHVYEQGNPPIYDDAYKTLIDPEYMDFKRLGVTIQLKFD